MMTRIKFIKRKKIRIGRFSAIKNQFDGKHHYNPHWKRDFLFAAPLPVIPVHPVKKPASLLTEIRTG
jgi:hypothetical protein